jgi:hypothetical protein
MTGETAENKTAHAGRFIFQRRRDGLFVFDSARNKCRVPPRMTLLAGSFPPCVGWQVEAPGSRKWTGGLFLCGGSQQEQVHRIVQSIVKAADVRE